MLDNIRRLCKDRHIPMVTLEKEAGLGMNTLIKWDRSSPSVDRVAAVADVLGVSIDELMGREKVNLLTPHEWELVQAFRDMNAYGKTALLEQVKIMGSMPMYKKTSSQSAAGGE